MSASSVAGVVVLYRPGPEVLDAVSSYVEQVDVLYAVDNTEEPDEALVASLVASGVIHVPNHQNLGVAAALNIGATRALAEGYQMLLTMDQDSVAESGMVDKLVQCLSRPGEGVVGLVSPYHAQVGGAERQPPEGCVPLLTPMTSGSLLSLSAYRAVGPFLEELFIDQVDNEFCLRLWAAGFSVLENGETTLTHRVGDVRRHRFPFHMYSTNHSPIRRYYMTRNRLRVGRMYAAAFPAFRRFERRQIAKDIVKIVLHEDQKRLKLRMMLAGYRDYRRGRFGRYEAIEHRGNRAS